MVSTQTSRQVRGRSVGAESARPALLSLATLTGQIPLLALIAVCVVAGLISDRFLSPININNVLLQGAVLTVIVIGMTFVIICGGFDLSVGSVVALSGCIAAMVMLEAGIVLGVPAGIAIGAVVGLVNGIVVTRLDVNPFIATLGTMVLVRGSVFLVTGGRPIVGEDGLPDLFNDFATERLFGVHYLIWLPVILVIVFSWVLHRTAYGVRVFATGGNTEAAYLAGINVKRVRTSVYVWCGALAGVGGVMLASRLQSGQPTAGAFYELTAVAAVVLGGAALFGGEGKLYKSVIGVFIMVVLANALNLANVHSYWQEIAVGSVIIAAAAADRWRHRRQ